MANFLKKTSRQAGQTIEANIHTGGKIVNIQTVVKLNTVDHIAINQFDNYLREKGINQQAATSFASLKFVKIGTNTKSEYIQAPTLTTCQKIGIAVKKTSPTEMKISIIWTCSTVEIDRPKTIIKTIIINNGVQQKTADNRSKQIERALTVPERQNIMNALQQESAKYTPNQKALRDV